MLDPIDQHRAQLMALCERYYVRKLEVFGSVAENRFQPESSDIDFLVEFLPQAAERLFSGYFDFKDELEALFGCRVDLVMPSAIRNPYFQRAVERQRRLLYAA